MDSRVITLEKQAGYLKRRKAKFGWTGPVTVQPNPDGRRTPAKRARLKAIGDSARAGPQAQIRREALIDRLSLREA